MTAIKSQSSGKNMENKTEEQKSSDYQYLEKLEFEPELRKSWLNFFVVNFRVVILLIVLITVGGVYAFFNLPRESNPEVKIPIAVVVTAYPGVSPADIEELVTKKIETGISGLKNIKTISSNSANSVSSITVEFDAKADLEDSIRKLREQVKNIEKDLPEDANEPQVKEISFDDTPVWTIALSGPEDGFLLRKYAEDIQDELEKIPDVREVNISGGDIREFQVAYYPDRLNSYGVSVDQANQAIKAANLTIPSGSFEGDQYTYPIKADARFYEAKNIENIPVGHGENNTVIYIKDLAKVEEKAIKHAVYSRLSTKAQKPQEAITIDVIKKTGGSILNTVDQAKKIVDAKVASLDNKVRYDVVTDMADLISQDFNRLTHDFILTLALVFAILFLIVGLKEAVVAGLAVPLVFFVSFMVMLATGISLNFLSIFSLILSLGLLVDDAIVVVSATKQYLSTGKFTPEEAVLLVLNDFKVVLTTTTLTTVWAFLPLLLSSGIMGEYIKSIPITVSVTLTASLLIALMINHPLAAVLERIRLTKKFFWAIVLSLTAFAGWILMLNSVTGYVFSVIAVLIIGLMLQWYFKNGEKSLLENHDLAKQEWKNDELIKLKLKNQGSRKEASFQGKLIHGIIHFDRVLPIYEKYLRKIISTKKRRRTALAGITIAFIFAVLLPVTGIVPTEFFPKSNDDTIFINLRAGTGLNLDETDKIVSRIEEKLLQYPEIINYSTIVGGSGANGMPGGGQSSSNLASLTINLIPKEERMIKSYEFATVLRNDFSDIKDATVTVSTPSAGPPSGASFEARITGEDLQTLDKIAKDLKPKLASIKGVVDADISLKDAPADYTFILDPERLELNGLNAAYVGATLRTAISGTKITTVIRQGKEIEVNAKFAENSLPDLEAIQNLQILNMKKQPVFLKDVANIELKPSVNNISRYNQKRAVTLTAGVEGETRPNEVLSEFQDWLKKDYKLPSGYKISYGGENEQNVESVLSIIRAMILAGVLIVSTLIIQFNSFKKAMIVLITIPLALIGVFFGMAVLRVYLSFPGLIGILALFGIVVKNAIILMDKINLNIKSGIVFEEAIIDAGKSRLEAIFITSIATILGILPITLSNELWMALGSAVIFGLMLSSFLTLFIVPTLYMSFIKKD